MFSNSFLAFCLILESNYISDFGMFVGQYAQFSISTTYQISHLKKNTRLKCFNEIPVTAKKKSVFLLEKSKSKLDK